MLLVYLMFMNVKNGDIERWCWWLCLQFLIGCSCCYDCVRLLSSYWHCSLSMQSRVDVTVWCPSVPAWAHSSKLSSAGLQAILIDCGTAGVWRANAGSAMLSVYVVAECLCSAAAGAVWVQKFPNEGLVNVVSNVFDFDSYNKELRETVTQTLHKHGIPVGANPRNLQLAKE